VKPGFGRFARLRYSNLQCHYSDEAEALVSGAKRALIVFWEWFTDDDLSFIKNVNELTNLWEEEEFYIEHDIDLLRISLFINQVNHGIILSKLTHKLYLITIKIVWILWIVQLGMATYPPVFKSSSQQECSYFSRFIYFSI